MYCNAKTAWLVSKKLLPKSNAGTSIEALVWLVQGVRQDLSHRRVEDVVVSKIHKEFDDLCILDQY
jgi:hypothetical protein